MPASRQTGKVSVTVVGNLGKIVLTPIHTPETVAIVAHARRIDRVNDDPRALRFFKGGVHIRVTGSATPKAIDAVGNHQDLAANRTFGPALDQVDHAEVEAGRRARVCQRKLVLAASSIRMSS